MEERKGLTGDNKENGSFKQQSITDCTSTHTRVKFDVADSVSAPDKSYTQLYERRLSFRNWPLSYISKSALAAAGFYYYPRASYDCCDCGNSKPDDRVRCYSCGLELYLWKEGDDPFDEHEKWSPKCYEVLEKQCSKEKDEH